MSAAQKNRIAGKGRLNAAKPLRFSFDGKVMQGLEGDTLASALIANDIHLVGRSFKYHRPRGILAAGVEEPNALVQVKRDGARTEPNVRATVAEIYDGFAADSQNRWPSLEYDIGAVNDLASPFIPAGFYYKTFMWPAKAWAKLYEPNIRRAAGLGKAPIEADPDAYANRFAHCDVLVIGAGAAGLAAALAAAEAGASVMICDEQAGVGGALKFETSAMIDGQGGHDWAVATAAKLAAMDNVRLLTRTTAFAYQAQNMVCLVERITEHLATFNADTPRERVWQVRAKRVIIAAGAIERHMVFAENDRPGIMLASAARTFLNHYGVAVGRNVGVFTANDSAYHAAIDLKKAGVNVAAIVDWRDAPAGPAIEDARALGIEVIPGAGVISTGGRLRVSSMLVQAKAGGVSRLIPVDALLMSAGWTPSVHMYSQSRGRVVWDKETGRFLPGAYPQDAISVGACNGAISLSETIDQALAAGERFANEAGRMAKRTALKGGSAESFEGGVSGALLGADQGETVKAFVDFQNDVTAKDIKLAVREGMQSIEHVKRFTTNGMASDQGKTSNIHGLAIAAKALDREVPQVGLTTFRMPYTPVTFGALVGHARGKLFDPARHTPIHAAHVALGADFEDVGLWKRAWYYPRAGEDMHAAVNREVKTVREVGGMFDASTLGKIEVVGPDAAEFLDRMYTNPFKKLEPGRLRYGIMCREDGFIYDDGVVARIAEDRFHVTTTTGGAPRVMTMMEDYLQTEWPHLKVYLTSISEQWAVIALQGPKAREVLAQLVEGVDISAGALPHMSYREGRILGVPMRLFKMSFTGEAGFEINVPSDHGLAVWEALYARLTALGGCAYGTEAMHVLRAEKGYIIVGQDTDGTVTPDDAGLGWAVGKKKADFVGIRGMKRADLMRPGRKQLVGLLTKDPKVVLEEGAQIVETPNQPVPMTMIGHVTSSYWSENCGRSIAMALIAGGNDKMGKTIFVPMPDGVIEAEIVKPVFVDAEGGRVHG
ncbi:MAG: sarcosine oxidase subunit alpha family protein [Rhizobiaceae bacterium]|nr:sarcosine oxidase subunit alpha family protein [Rhizobiaceae bacterium]